MSHTTHNGRCFCSNLLARPTSQMGQWCGPVWTCIKFACGFIAAWMFPLDYDTQGWRWKLRLFQYTLTAWNCNLQDALFSKQFSSKYNYVLGLSSESVKYGRATTDQHAVKPTRCAAFYKFTASFCWFLLNSLLIYNFTVLRAWQLFINSKMVIKKIQKLCVFRLIWKGMQWCVGLYILR